MKEAKYDKMNNKGETSNVVGIFVAGFMVIVVAIALFQASAYQVGTATGTGTVVNTTLTLGAGNTSQDLVGQNLISGLTIVNWSGQVVLTNGANVTIAEGVSPRTGTLRIIATVNQGTYANQKINVSYVYGPEGYINDSGGRAIASLILIFFALAIAVVALVPALRNGVADYLNL